MRHPMVDAHDSLARTLGWLIDYIEDNLSGVITLDALELESGLSRFQLTRIFKRLCGHPPIEYVKRRKISSSITDLYAGKTIIDIALDFGFEYEQSYIRAFRSVYGVSPGRLRRSSQTVELLEPIVLKPLLVRSDRMVTDPKITYLSGLSFQGEELFYNYKENDVRGRPLTDAVSRLRCGIFTGICFPCGRGSFTHRYLRCIEGDNRCATFTLPDGKHAVFTYAGLHPLDSEGAHKIRTLTYIVISQWAAAHDVLWERHYVEQIERTALSEDYCEVQIMVPVRPWT